MFKIVGKTAADCGGLCKAIVDMSQGICFKEIKKRITYWINHVNYDMFALKISISKIKYKKGLLYVVLKRLKETRAQ